MCVCVLPPAFLGSLGCKNWGRDSTTMQPSAAKAGAEPLPQSVETGTFLSSLSHTKEAARSSGREDTDPESSWLPVLAGTIKDTSSSTNIPDLVKQSSDQCDLSKNNFARSVRYISNVRAL